jgi:hypothetical protein
MRLSAAAMPISPESSGPRGCWELWNLQSYPSQLMSSSHVSSRPRMEKRIVSESAELHVWEWIPRLPRRFTCEVTCVPRSNAEQGITRQRPPAISITLDIIAPRRLDWFPQDFLPQSSSLKILILISLASVRSFSPWARMRSTNGLSILNIDIWISSCSVG